MHLNCPQEVGDGQEIGVHEVGDARCRKQQADDGVDEKTVAEPATFEVRWMRLSSRTIF